MVQSKQDIDYQIKQLKQIFDNDIINFNALFLGEHDALNAPEDLILETIKRNLSFIKFKDIIYDR